MRIGRILKLIFLKEGKGNLKNWTFKEFFSLQFTCIDVQFCFTIYTKNSRIIFTSKDNLTH